MFFIIERTWAIGFSKYKELELYVSQNIKDLRYMILMIKRTWAICFGELKGLDFYDLNEKGTWATYKWELKGFKY